MFLDSHHTVLIFDTWSCPILGLVCVLMLRPTSPELVLLSDFWVSNIASQLVRFARCCTSVFDFHSKNLQITSNYWHRVTDITFFGKRLEISLGHTLNFCPNLVQYRFKNMYLKESFTLLLRKSCLQTKEGQRRSEFYLVGLENIQTPLTSSVWPSDHREDYRSCASSFYSLVQIIP